MNLFRNAGLTRQPHFSEDRTAAAAGGAARIQRFSARHAGRAAALALAAIWLLPSAALAQPVAFGYAQVPVDSDEIPNELSVYVSGDYSSTPYNAVFDGNIKTTGNGATDSLLTYSLQDRQQTVNTMGVSFGARFPLGPKLTLLAGLGVSQVTLSDSKGSGSLKLGKAVEGYNAEFRAKQVDMNPGFSASVGILWEMVRYSRFSFLMGLNTTYFSSYSSKGGAVTVTATQGANSTTNSETDTTDLSLHLFNIQPHVGVQWRPIRTFIVNSFGMFGQLVASAATLTEQSAATNAPTTDVTVKLSLKPQQYLGAFYGWYFAVPRLGVVGVEAQYGTRLSIGVNYQYMF